MTMTGDSGGTDKTGYATEIGEAIVNTVGKCLAQASVFCFKGFFWGLGFWGAIWVIIHLMGVKLF